MCSVCWYIAHSYCPLPFDTEQEARRQAEAEAARVAEQEAKDRAAREAQARKEAEVRGIVLPSHPSSERHPL